VCALHPHPTPHHNTTTSTRRAHWPWPAGETPRRAQQLWRALYAGSRWVTCLDQADAEGGNAFSKFGQAFRAKVAASASLSGGLTLQSVHSARDGTKKLVFALHQDEGAASGSVETVLIPMINK
jgi:23S rRNA (adenine2503-C2)-methyltransferase